MKRYALLKYVIAAAMRREPGYAKPIVFLRHTSAAQDPVPELILQLRAARTGHSEAAEQHSQFLCDHYRTWWRACARALTQIRNIDTDLIAS